MTRETLEILIVASDKASGVLKNIGGVLGTVGKVGLIAAGGGLAALAGGLGLAAKQGLDMNAMLEKTTLQFTTLMGDSDAAKQHVADLFKFAGETPFETEPILNASKALLTFGGSALNTMDNLRLVGDSAAAVNQPIEDVSFWFGRAYSSIQAGRPFGEAAARLQEMGILSAEGRNRIEELQKSGADTTVVWDEMTKEFGKFDGAMKLQAGTWDGLMSTLSDGLKIASATAFKPFFDLLKTGLEGFTSFVSSENFTAWAQQIADFATTTLIPAFQTIVAVLQALFSGDFGLAMDEMREGFLGILPPEVIEAFANLIAWVRDVGLPALQELGTWITTVGVPAFISIATAVWEQLGPGLAQLGVWIQDLAKIALPILQKAIQFVVDHWQIFAVIAGIVAAIILALNAPIAFIAAALVLFATAWANNWGGIRDVLTNIWNNILQPIFSTVFEWLRDRLSFAIQYWSDTWTNTLKPAIETVWSWISGVLIPFLRDVLFPMIKTTLTEAIQTLTNYWTNTLLPAITNVWNFFNTYILPILKEVANIAKTVLGIAIEALAGLWQNVLLPAITGIYNFFKDKVLPILKDVATYVNDTLGPKIQWLNDNVFAPLGRTLSGGLKTALQWVYDTLVKLGGFLANFSLPDWLTPGSPTPFELGLRGIADAMDEINAMRLPSFQTQLGMAGMAAATMGQSSVTNNNNFYLNANYPYQSPTDVSTQIRILEMLYG